MSTIDVDKVSKLYDDKVVFKTTSFSIDKGSIVAFVGKSGAGKSTLLRILAGIEPFSTGKISIFGQPITEYRAKNQVGFVFQKPTLFPWLTLKENIIIPIKANSNYECNKSEHIEELINNFGLKPYEHLYPAQLSGGMIQRTTVARSMAANSNLLFIDEGFNSLDEVMSESLWTLFRSIWKSNNSTVLISTHNIKEALSLSDKIYVVKQSSQNLSEPLIIDQNFNESVNIINHKLYNEYYRIIRTHLLAESYD